MASSLASCWSGIFTQPAKPSTPAPPAPVALDACKSSKGLSVAVVDANAIIQGGERLASFADRFASVSEVVSEIRDRLSVLPFTVEMLEPSPESLRKVESFAQTLSDVDMKLIALTYTLEAQIHGTKHLRGSPPPVHRLIDSKILPVKCLSLNVQSEDTLSNKLGSEQSWSLSESSVACVTRDFAMQNVILQMGLRLLAPGGKQISELHRWVLKCDACCKVTNHIRRIFCPLCGNCGTLRKVDFTVGENGIALSANSSRCPCHRMDMMPSQRTRPAKPFFHVDIDGSIIVFPAKNH